MNIVIISANSRKESQSLKIAKWFAQQALVDGCDVELIDLHASQLPLELDKLWGKDPATMQI